MEENRILRKFRLFFREKKPRLNLTPEERKKRKNESNKRWERKNPEKVRAINRRRLEKHRTEIYEYQRKWRRIKQYESRLRQRLAFRRSKQRQLALQLIENEPYKLSNRDIEKLLPTSALTQLLR